MDTNGDGVGDLARHHRPARPSAVARRRRDLARSRSCCRPNKDWGYDVADYVGVDPALGTLADARRARSPAADARGHPRAPRPRPEPHERPSTRGSSTPASSRDAAHRDWYVWADPKPDGSPPNNWVMAFDPAPAWTFDDASGQYYLQPLPRRRSPTSTGGTKTVRDAFDRILRFWFDRGVAGFRIDVCHSIIKDRELRDNPPADQRRPLVDADERAAQRVQRVPARGARRAAPLAQASPTATTRRALFVGETYVLDLDAARCRSTATATSCNLAFNFMFVFTRFEAAELRAVVEQAEAHLPAHAWPVWTWRQPRQPPLRDPLVRRRPAPRPGRAGDAHGPARHRRSSTTATRSACPTPSCPSTAPRPGRHVPAVR